MKDIKKPDEVTPPAESTDADAKVLHEIAQIKIQLEASEKKNAELLEKLQLYVDEVEKLKSEIAGEVEKVAPKPPEDPEIAFMRKYPKESYMVVHAIDHGFVDHRTNKVVKEMFNPGEPFPKAHSLFKKALSAGNIKQIKPD